MQQNPKCHRKPLIGLESRDAIYFSKYIGYYGWVLYLQFTGDGAPNPVDMKIQLTCISTRG